MSWTAEKKKLGEILVVAGVVQGEQLQAALGHQSRWGGRLGEVLIGMGFCRESEISAALSRQLGIPEVELTGMSIPESVLGKLPVDFCLKHRLLPFAQRRDERGAAFLHVAMADPTDLEVIDAIRFQAGLNVEVAVASEIEISLAIRRHFHLEIERASPFGESRKEHRSTGELLRFGEEPVSMDSLGELYSTFSGGGISLSASSSVEEPTPSLHGLGSLYDESDPAFRAVEALVKILTRKGILEEGEFLDEILRELPRQRK